MIVLHMILIEFHITVTMAQPLYRDNKIEQPEAVNSAENAIEHDAIDILTEYPPWSTDTYDICDEDEVIYDMICLTVSDHAHLVHAHWLAFCIYMIARYVKRDFYTHN